MNKYVSIGLTSVIKMHNLGFDVSFILLLLDAYMRVVLDAYMRVYFIDVRSFELFVMF